jgi:hypothetical protein
MQNKLFRKGLVVGVILLFLCLIYTSIINAETKNSLNINTIKSVPYSYPSFYHFIAFGKFYVENKIVKGHYFIMFVFYYSPEIMFKISKNNDYVKSELQIIYIYSKHVIIGWGYSGW